MRVGVHVGAWSSGYGPSEQLKLARAAEELGFDGVWVAENCGSDGTSALAWLAAGTQRVTLGSAVLQIAGRTPALAAMAAATVDGVSGGRFVLGLGLSGPQLVDGWHGQPYDRPLRRLREYVEVVRLALAGERLSYDGEVYGMPRPNGQGKPLKLMIGPVQERIPIYLGVFGPQATAVAAEVADGWIPFFWWPERADVFHPALERGSARAGRSLDDLHVAPFVYAALGDDLEACRARFRPTLAFFIGAAGSRERNFYADLVRRYGYADVADRVQDLSLAGERARAEAAVPDELVDALTLCSPPARAAEQLRAFRHAGANSVLVGPAATSADERIETLAALAPLVQDGRFHG